MDNPIKIYCLYFTIFWNFLEIYTKYDSKNAINVKNAMKIK
jgi:hypothetical protein